VLSSQKEGQWICEFCGHSNSVSLQSEELPREEAMDYLLEPAQVSTRMNHHRRSLCRCVLICVALAEAAQSAALGEDQAMVIFCIDISGSMCVTTEARASWLHLPTNSIMLFDLHDRTNDLSLCVCLCL
jgi:hypothetical protein